MAPQLNERKWSTRSQIDPVTAWKKQARCAAGRCVQAAGRESMKGALTQLRHQCEQSAQWAISATRCDDKCANTALLETQRPCGSARRCRSDTVPHDTSVPGRCHTVRPPRAAPSSLFLPSPCPSDHERVLMSLL